jgi:hypothetical protein
MFQQYPPLSLEERIVGLSYNQHVRCVGTFMIGS